MAFDTNAGHQKYWKTAVPWTTENLDAQANSWWRPGWHDGFICKYNHFPRVPLFLSRDWCRSIIYTLVEVELEDASCSTVSAAVGLNAQKDKQYSQYKAGYSLKK